MHSTISQREVSIQKIYFMTSLLRIYLHKNASVFPPSPYKYTTSQVKVGGMAKVLTIPVKQTIRFQADLGSWAANTGGSQRGPQRGSGS